MPSITAQEVRDLKTSGKPTFDFPLFKGRRFDYQFVGAELAFRVRRFLLMDPVGLGKTSQALLLASKIIEQRRLNFRKKARVLIAVDSSCLHQWKGEVRRFLDMDAILPLGQAAARKKIYENLASRDECIVLVNHSKLFADFDRIQTLLKPDALVIDEAVIVANKNKTHEHARWVARVAEFVCLLTAEPITRGDLVQIRNLFLVLGLNLMDSEEEFVDKFIVQEKKKAYVRGKFGPYKREVAKTTGAKNVDVFKQLIYYNAIRRPESVLGDARIINRQLITVEMTPLQAERYAEIRKKILSDKEGRRELNAISTAGYISQVLCSPWIIDKSAPQESPKAEAVVRLAQRLAPEKLVVFANWKDMHKLLAPLFKQAGIVAVFYNGDASDAERDEALTSFTKDPKTQVLVMTKAGQRGLNLQVARNICLVDLLHSPSAIRQIIGRVDRIGQLARVINFFILAAEGSSEMNILRVLRDRQSVIDEVFDEQKAGLFDDTFRPEELLLAV